MLRKGPATLLLSLLAAAATAQDAVDVVALRAETRQLEQQMYELYNSLNRDDDFDVTCDEKKVTGSTIPEWTCEAAFMRNAATRSVASRFDNPLSGAANTQSGFIPQSQSEIAFSQRRKTRELNEEMLDLARKNQELASAMIALNEKRQQLEAADK